jgi:hypothetical protein
MNTSLFNNQIEQLQYKHDHRSEYAELSGTNNQGEPTFTLDGDFTLAFLRDLVKLAEDHSPAPSTDTPKPNPLERLLAFQAAQKLYHNAHREMIAAERALKEAIEFHDEMDDRAIPDGNGHFWIVRVCNYGNSMDIRHTSSLTL